MYPAKIEKKLKKLGIKVGDHIRVSGRNFSYEGILMPRIRLGDTSNLVIKLKNGYNIGIAFDKIEKIELIKKGRPIKFKPRKGRIEKRRNLPSVSVLGCGGTIASRVEYTTGAVFPAFSPADLLEAFPKIKDIANIDSKKLFDLFSEDMTPHHWVRIAKECSKEIKKGADGVVLMHGTDTMHYTSAALSFMLQNLPVPVVLVGAQRSSDRGSSDNEMNLLAAITTAGHSDIAEVSVCMHATSSDDYCYVHQGTKVRKMHTSSRDAFKSVNAKPFAKVWYESGGIEYLRNDYRKRDRKRKLKLDAKINPNVALIYFYPGMKPEILKSVAKHCDGLVIAGTGMGHVATNPFGDKLAKSLVPTIKSLVQSGIPVVMAPQTLFGRLNMNVYTAGRLLLEAGVIGNYCDWLPEVALVKLMWVLGHTKSMKKIRKMMLTNIAGEISERSEIYD